MAIEKNNRHKRWSALIPMGKLSGNALRSIRRFRVRRFGGSKITILIDFDNVNEIGVRTVFAELDSRWNAVIRRAYGLTLRVRRIH